MGKVFPAFRRETEEETEENDFSRAFFDFQPHSIHSYRFVACPCMRLASRTRSVLLFSSRSFLPLRTRTMTAASPAWKSLGTPSQELRLEFTLPTGQTFRWRQTAEK